MAIALPESYYALVRAFPLVPIRDEEHASEATAVVDDLTARDLDDGEEAYLDVLTDLVEAYEAEAMPFEDVPGGEVLKELIEANRLSQHELAKRVGIAQSTISALICGDRAFTVEHAKVLGRHFGVGPAAFLDL